jgi:hypothetical protein
MPRWVKRPVVIDAVRYVGLGDDGQPEFDCFGEPYPRWLSSAFHRRRLYVHRDVLFANTLEGQMVASRYDYIIRGVKGEIYPCKPDIFENNHSRAA